MREITQVLTMVLFAALMVMASLSMMKSRQTVRNVDQHTAKPLHLPKLLAYGVAIGLATGILGAGGGFLLIPTLVLLVGMPMKQAVGTSLMIIALNSLIGFTGHIGHFVMDWYFLLKVTAIAVSGIFIRGLISKKISAEKLKKGFGWFVLLMGIYIIFRELLFSK